MSRKSEVIVISDDDDEIVFAPPKKRVARRSAPAPVVNIASEDEDQDQDPSKRNFILSGNRLKVEAYQSPSRRPPQKESSGSNVSSRSNANQVPNPSKGGLSSSKENVKHRSPFGEGGLFPAYMNLSDLSSDENEDSSSSAAASPRVAAVQGQLNFATVPEEEQEEEAQTQQRVPTSPAPDTVEHQNPSPELAPQAEVNDHDDYNDEAEEHHDDEIATGDQEGDPLEKSFSSINTNSPLITRLQQRQQVVTAPNSTQNPVETVDFSMEALIQGFYQTLKDEVALEARVLLHDATKCVDMVPNRFLDRESPWKALKGLGGRDDSATQGKKMLLETRVAGKTNNHKIKVGSKITIKAVSIRDMLPIVPKYTSLTIANRNFLTPDDKVLRYVPYLGEESSNGMLGHKRLMKELEASYSNEGIAPREAELCNQTRGYLDSWLTEVPSPGLSQQILQRFLLQENFNIPKSCQGFRKALLRHLGGPLEGRSYMLANEFNAAYTHVFDVDLADAILPESHLKDLIQRLRTFGEEDKAPPGHTEFATFSQWMCLICGVAYCQVHGDYNHVEKQALNEGDKEYDFYYQPLGLHFPDLLRGHALRVKEQDRDVEMDDNKTPCTAQCYVHGTQAAAQYEPWPQKTIEMLKQYLVIFKDTKSQSCIISAALNLPCWQVARAIEKHSILDSGTMEQSNPQNRQHARLDWYDNEKKILHHHWEEKTSSHKHEERNQLNTCAHEGPCTLDNCTCAREGILCERWCCCSQKCGRRFTGCSCASNGVCCTTDSCICVQLNRECGPECVPCGALERINPANKYNDALFTTKCQNIVLQRGVPKQIIIGESTLEGVGFGAFMAEPALKGDFLGDYVGEVITFTESERRAIIYERKHSTFLFDLNSEWTIDGARQGSKTRFINHASTDQEGRNCGAKVLLANGQQRIKFFAIRDINPGEELLFDYGKKFTETHFIQKLQTVSGKKASAVLKGKELDALDGFTTSAKVTKEKIAGNRGGARPGAGRPPGSSKSRKAAPQKEVVVQEDLDEDSESHADTMEEAGSDSEDGDVQRGRPKRTTKKPLRYTR